MKVWLVAAAILLAEAMFTGSGFDKRTDVYVRDYTVAPGEQGGSVLTVETELAGSMGYIRAASAQADGDALYVSFYTAFGGLNSSLGAQSTFELPLEPGCRAVYFDRGEGNYALVLQKEEGSEHWELQ